MDEIFLPPPGSGPDVPEPVEHLDPLLEKRLERRPWEIRTAQWRAWALAEAVFGEGVQVRLTGRGVSMGFRGLLTLSVPFSEHEAYRRRESLFMAWAREDPILTRVPLLFVFEPVAASLP